MKKFLSLLGLGAAATYFFHPQEGKRRRSMAQDRVSSMFRRSAQKGGELGQSVSSQAQGMAAKAGNLREEPKDQPDDVTLARKVESEIFRDDGVPKGQINVNAENGKIVLRGEVGQPEMIKDLEERARAVQGVSDVENLLHLPGTEAPMHE
jgi:osmotically-inducible protein OsmY